LRQKGKKNMKIMVMVVIGAAMVIGLSGCGALLSTFVPQQPAQQPSYPVYVDQQQQIVVPTTTTVSPTPTIVVPNY